MLTLRDVGLEQAGRRLVHGLSLELSAGQAALVEGPNGSGKTTLLRAVCGWRPVSEGCIEWRGRALPRACALLRTEMAWLGHRDALHEDLSPRENLHWSMTLAGEGLPRDALNHALDVVGLDDERERPVRFLSQGQRRRAALARFVLTRKRLWILDEPLAALDTAAQSGFRACLMQHLLSGGIALLTCHTHSWPRHPSIQRLSLPVASPPQH